MNPHDLRIDDVFAANARRHADGAAFIDGDEVLTHAAYWQRCERLAAGLAAIGVREGDRLSLLSHNRLEFVELLGAAARLGAVVSAINWRLSADEVAAVVASDRPTLLFIEDAVWALADKIPAKASGAPQRIAIGDSPAGIRSFHTLTADSQAPAAVDGSDAPLLSIHTAWSDGRPKAAMLSHRNLLTAAAQLQAPWQLRPDDVHLCALPLFHITAVSLALATQLAGGCSILLPRFDAAQAADLIERRRATLFGEFAPMLEGLLDQPDAARRLASVRHVCGLDSPAVIGRFEAACPGATFWTGFGQSESSGLVAMAPFRAAEGSVGHALPHGVVEVVDDLGQPCARGATGEITVRGPGVFLGYWERAAETTHAFRSGRLHTGDAGRIDDKGRLVYTGRLAAKELIKTGGENVYPAEVEQVLRTHAAVLDAAVIGVPDAKWGESVRAVCVMRNDARPQELIDFVGTRIAHFKRPRSVVFATDLPRKADGTHDRDRIKALHGA